MKPVKLTLALAMCVFAQAAASAEISGCFSASYNAAHLTKYPSQTPTFLSVLITRQDGNTMFDVTAMLRGKRGKWGEAGGCFASGPGLKCSVDCDGGGFELQANGNLLTLSNTRGFRIAEVSCEGETTIHVVDPVPGNRMFTLHRSDEKTCQ